MDSEIEMIAEKLMIAFGGMPISCSFGEFRKWSTSSIDHWLIRFEKYNYSRKNHRRFLSSILLNKMNIGELHDYIGIDEFMEVKLVIYTENYFHKYFDGCMDWNIWNISMFSKQEILKSCKILIARTRLMNYIYDMIVTGKWRAPDCV